MLALLHQSRWASRVFLRRLLPRNPLRNPSSRSFTIKPAFTHATPTLVLTMPSSFFIPILLAGMIITGNFCMVSFKGPLPTRHRLQQFPMVQMAGKFGPSVFILHTNPRSRTCNASRTATQITLCCTNNPSGKPCRCSVSPFRMFHLRHLIHRSSRRDALSVFLASCCVQFIHSNKASFLLYTRGSGQGANPRFNFRKTQMILLSRINWFPSPSN